MASSSNAKKHLRFITSDGKFLELEESAAMQSETIKNLLEDFGDGKDIPLPNIDGETMAKAIDWMKRHVDEDGGDELRNWDDKYIDVDLSMLFNLLQAANYLEIKNLLNLCCQKVADLIKYKTLGEIREIFNIKNDFTPEEEAKIREENAWAFE